MKHNIRLYYYFFVFQKKQKKKGSAPAFNFSALHLVHDPQGMFLFLCDSKNIDYKFIINTTY